MTPFPDLAFLTAQFAGRLVTVHTLAWTVIAREDKQCVVAHVQFLERVHYPAQYPIHEEDLVAAPPRLALALHELRRQPRDVRCGNSKIEEKGVVGRSGYVLFEKPDRFFGKRRVGFLVLPLRLHVHNPMVFNKQLRRIVGRIRRRAEEIVKPEFCRSVEDGFGEINGSSSLLAAFYLFFQRPVETQMPLANACCAVSMLLQQRRNRHTVGLDQRAVVPPEHASLQPAAPAVPARQQPVPRGGTHGRWRMGVREEDTLPRQPVHVRCRDFAVRIVAAHIAIAHVIGHDEDDVGPFSALVQRQRPLTHTSGQRQGGCAQTHGLQKFSTVPVTFHGVRFSLGYAFC